MRAVSERRRVQKVVGYVVRDDRLLVFTHDDFPLEVTGIQVWQGASSRVSTLRLRRFATPYVARCYR